LRPILISAGILAAVGVGWFLTHGASIRLASCSYDELTPETVIEWCGPPLKDHVESSPEIPSIKYRTLVYLGTEEGVLVNVNFMAGNVTDGQFYFIGTKMGLEKVPASLVNVAQIEIMKQDRHLNLSCLP
jgi:hypothetical protein